MFKFLKAFLARRKNENTDRHLIHEVNKNKDITSEECLKFFKTFRFICEDNGIHPSIFDVERSQRDINEWMENSRPYVNDIVAKHGLPDSTKILCKEWKSYNSAIQQITNYLTNNVDNNPFISALNKYDIVSDFLEAAPKELFQDKVNLVPDINNVLYMLVVYHMLITIASGKGITYQSVSDYCKPFENKGGSK